MRYVSTRGGQAVGIETAIMGGTAADGGLYVPEVLPGFAPADFSTPYSFPEVATTFLTPFFAGSTLAGRLEEICQAALNFPLPLRQLEASPRVLSVLELFHGPTAAFKDVGARFLAHCMEQIIRDGVFATAPVTVLVATSGDTGGAVAAA